MADGVGEHQGVRNDHDTARTRLPARRDQRWPVSAVCWVAVLAVLVLVLLLMNVFGLQLGRDGQYDPEAGGSIAEWFGAIATLVALPAAVLFGIRQLQSSGEAIQLGQRQLEADQAERAERRNAELAAVRQSLRLAVEVTNVVDAADLASAPELAAVERWRHEYAQRGWVPDGDTATWQQGTLRRSNAELLVAEPSPLVPRPWFVVVTCHNRGGAALSVQRWTVALDGVTTTIEAARELRPGDRLQRRLGPDVGLDSAYTSQADAAGAAERLTVVVDGHDLANRSIRIVNPPPE